jgi:hypothetical protein
VEQPSVELRMSDFTDQDSSAARRLMTDPTTPAFREPIPLRAWEQQLANLGAGTADAAVAPAHALPAGMTSVLAFTLQVWDVFRTVIGARADALSAGAPARWRGGLASLHSPPCPAPHEWNPPVLRALNSLEVDRHTLRGKGDAARGGASLQVLSGTYELPGTAHWRALLAFCEFPSHDPDQVVAVLLDADKYRQYDKRCTHNELVKTAAQAAAQVKHVVMAGLWPISARAVWGASAAVRFGGGVHCLVTKSIDPAGAGSGSGERLQASSATAGEVVASLTYSVFVLEPMEGGGTRVCLQSHMRPGGSVEQSSMAASVAGKVAPTEAAELLRNLEQVLVLSSGKH